MGTGAGTATQPRQIAAFPGSVTSLVVSGADAYVAFSGTPTGRLVHVSTDGGCVETLVDAVDVRELAVDDRFVYYVANGAGLMRVGRAGQAAEPIGGTVSSSLVADGASVYFLRGPDVIALDEGDGHETILTSWVGAGTLGLDADSIFVGRETRETVFGDGRIVRDDGGIRKIARVGGGSATTLTTVSAQALAAVDGWVYFTYDASLARISKQGGAVERIATVASSKGLRGAAGRVHAFGATYVVAYDAGAGADASPILVLTPRQAVLDVAADGAATYFAETVLPRSSALLRVDR